MPEAPAREKRGPWARLAIVAAVCVVFALAVLGARPILVAVARGVIWEDAITQDLSRPVWVVLTAGHRRVPETYDFVADLAGRFGAKRIIVFSRPLTRVEELGVLPPAGLLACNELRKRIDLSLHIEAYPGFHVDFWDEARTIASIKAESGKSVVVCVPRFGSRVAKTVLTKVLSPVGGEGIVVQPVPDPRYDENTWWKTRAGWKALFWAYNELLATWLFGEPEKFLPLSVESYESWAEAYVFRSCDHCGEKTRTKLTADRIH
ncbi:MAG: hypothetical protein NZ899_03070 [Thermoguttaceae bacterium]|nr:hypothetical protein [Thermoguttaceae bacterium]MDW8078904.1 hypothetical protein [Thermoguttaceae bacterium]